jgi:Cof subfamily protein (haloacid dehalogenase superfamily)
MQLEVLRMKNRIKLVISDLDGTLLNKDHALSEYTKSVVKALTNENIPFWIATGRHHCDALNISKKLGVDTFLITANGATIADFSGELIDQAFIEKEIIENILKIEVPEGVYQNLYKGAHWLMEEPDQVFAKYYKEDDFHYTLCKFEDHLHEPINKVFFTSYDNEKLIPIANAVTQMYGEHIDVTFSMPQCLEIMPKGVNKGEAILKSLKRYGIEPHEVIAFGDGLNDLEMLQVVGKGYVMGNAHPILKEKLAGHESIGDNGDDAVAKHLVELFELHERIIA